MNGLGTRLKAMKEALPKKEHDIMHDHTAPDAVQKPIEQQKAGSKHGIEQVSENIAHDQTNLHKADGEPKKKAAPYGTDPAVAQQVNDRFNAIHDKMVANINAHPQMKMGEKKKRLADLARKKKYFSEGVHIANHVQNIKNMAPDDPNLPSTFISDGNEKLSKDGIVSWNLPAGHTCPGKGDCFGFCYAMQGPQSWPAALKKRHDNFGVAERDDFVPRMNAELKRWGKSGKKNRGDVVRVHDSGDFYSQDYINKWADIAKSNPDKHFYAYTKAHHLDFSPLHSLPNFKIIQSVGGNQDHKIDVNKPHAFIFPSHEALHAAGYADASDSDAVAADPANKKVGLVIHGIRSGQYDAGEYGKGLKKSGGRYHLVAGEIPDVHKFDQPDAPHQLKYSRHPADRLKALRLKLHEGSYSSAMDAKIKHIKSMYKDHTEPTNEQQAEKMKAKYAQMLKTDESDEDGIDQLHKNDPVGTTPDYSQGSSIGTSGTNNIDTNKAAATSKAFSNSGGMAGIQRGIGNLASAGSAAMNALGFGKSRPEPKEELKKGIMSPGSTKDKFPKTYGALEIDGDLHNHEVLRHHMGLHQKAMLQAKNPESARHHLDNIQKIQNHLDSLKKNQVAGYGEQSMPKLPGPNGENTANPKVLAQSADGNSEGLGSKMKAMKASMQKAMPPTPPKPPEPKVEKPKEPKKAKENKVILTGNVGGASIKGV